VRLTSENVAGESVESQLVLNLCLPNAVRNGHIKRITDQDIQSSVLEIMSTNVSTTYITCPADPTKTLGIKLPFLVMIIKNLKKYFSFEVQVLDDKNVRRRFRASNYQVGPAFRLFLFSFTPLQHRHRTLSRAAHCCHTFNCRPCNVPGVPCCSPQPA
jgi:hypothetical protein